MTGPHPPQNIKLDRYPRSRYKAYPSTSLRRVKRESHFPSPSSCRVTRGSYLVFFCCILSLVVCSSGFRCSFCEEDLPGEWPNKGYSWKIAPHSWNGTYSCAYHAMAFEVKSKRDNSFSVLLVGGVNETNEMMKNSVSGSPLVKITFDPNGNESTINWDFQSSYLFPAGISGHTLTYYNGCSGCMKQWAYEEEGMFMYGGMVNMGNSSEDEPIYSSEYIITIISQNSTVNVYKPSLSISPPPRAFHTALWTLYYVSNNSQPSAGHIIVFGGIQKMVAYNDVWLYDISNEIWLSLPIIGIKPPPRSHHVAAVWGSKMIIFGGLVPNPVSVLGDLWTLDLASNTWSQPLTQGTPPTARYAATAQVITEGRMLILGGYVSESKAMDVYSYSITQQTWEQHCTELDIADTNRVLQQFAHKSVLVGPNQILIFGGFFLTEQLVPPVWKLYDADVYRSQTFCELRGQCMDRVTCLELQNMNLNAKKCDGLFPFVCSSLNGTTCVASLSECVGKGCNDLQQPYQCWNGLCATAPEYCPTMEYRCPVGMQRCSNGTCSLDCGEAIVSNCLPLCSKWELVEEVTCLAICSEANDYPCCPKGECCSTYNRSCLPWETQQPQYCLGSKGWGCEDRLPGIQSYTGCQPFDGCPPPFFQCPDGNCVLKLKDCSDWSALVPPCNSVTPYPCADGTCALNLENCTNMPMYWQKFLPTSTEGNQNTGIDTNTTTNGTGTNKSTGSSTNSPGSSNSTGSSIKSTGSSSAGSTGSIGSTGTESTGSTGSIGTTGSTGIYGYIGANTNSSLYSQSGSVLSVLQFTSTSGLPLYIEVLPSPSESNVNGYTPLLGWSSFYRGVGGRPYYFTNILSAILVLKINGQMRDSIKQVGCLAYLDNTQKWTCIPAKESGFPMSWVSGLEVYLGGTVTAESFQEGNVSQGTFAVVRRKWSPPTTNQIILDIQKRITIKDWQDLLQDLVSYKIQDHTIQFTFLVSPDKNSVESNIADLLLLFYGISSSRLNFNFTEPSKREATVSQYALSLTLLDVPLSPPPSITPNMTISPEPSTELAPKPYIASQPNSTSHQTEANSNIPLSDLSVIIIVTAGTCFLLCILIIVLAIFIGRCHKVSEQPKPKQYGQMTGHTLQIIQDPSVPFPPSRRAPGVYLGPPSSTSQSILPKYNTDSLEEARFDEYNDPLSLPLPQSNNPNPLPILSHGFHLEPSLLGCLPNTTPSSISRRFISQWPNHTQTSRKSSEAAEYGCGTTSDTLPDVPILPEDSDEEKIPLHVLGLSSRRKKSFVS